MFLLALFPTIKDKNYIFTMVTVSTRFVLKMPIPHPNFKFQRVVPESMSRGYDKKTPSW